MFLQNGLEYHRHLMHLFMTQQEWINALALLPKLSTIHGFDFLPKKTVRQR
jgi:hypothetical protein